MLKFEAILLDPSPGEIADRLSDATAAANKRCRTRLLADDPAKWRKFARQTQAAPEGFDLFRGGKGGVPGTQLVAAWWTDHIGRKHVVLRGRRIEHEEAKILLDKSALATRPPLWHCYPQYLYQRIQDARTDWLAVCGCGAVGTPEALGWMGETCGPCHDRREEGGDLRGNRAGWLHGVRNPFVAVAFSRDGAKVAAMEEDGIVSVWNLESIHAATRFESQYGGGISRASVLFVGPRDEYLATNAISDPASGVYLHDLRTLDIPARRLDSGYMLVQELAPTTDVDRVLIATDLGISLHRVPPLEYVNIRFSSPNSILHPSASPTPSHAVLTSVDGVRVFETGTLTEVATIPYRPHSGSEHHVYHRHRAAYHEPTRTVFVGRHNELEVYDLDRRQYTKVLRTVNSPLARLTGHNAPILALAVSVDQRHLFILTWDRVVVLDAVTHAAVAAFAWHLGPIRGLAVSPDGQTLATIGVEGVVKLWPIDRLIGSE